jgi:DNA-binding FrmR family transcriptional regulator
MFYLFFVMLQVPDTDKYMLIRGNYCDEIIDQVLAYSESYTSCKSKVIGECRLKNMRAHVDIRKQSNYNHKDVHMWGPDSSIY